MADDHQQLQAAQRECARLAAYLIFDTNPTRGQIRDALKRAGVGREDLKKHLEALVADRDAEEPENG